MAEVIKYGIIRDPGFFTFLEKSMQAVLQLDAETVSTVIRQCCLIKADITAQDETEKGIRAHLNYGHTLGHAVETLTGYSRFLHGEAVAIGMLAVAQLSQTLGFCGSEDVGRIDALLRDADLPGAIPPYSVSDYLHAMLKDKKKTGSTSNVVLMRRIGDVFLQSVAQEQLQTFLNDALAAR